MESPRDPLPAYLSAEPDPADPPPAETTGPQAAQPSAGSAARSAAQSAAGPQPRPAVPRPRDPGESTEPLCLGASPEPLPPSDADLIAASRAGDAAAYDTLYRRHVTAAHGLARQLVRNRQDGQLAGAGYLGWTLVVVTGDPAAPSGQVMVLDGARRMDAAHPGLSVPLGGLLAGQAIRVHTVAWTGHGPRFSAFTQPLTARPAVSFSAARSPYLVGVITAATPLAPPASPAPTILLLYPRPGTPRPRSASRAVLGGADGAQVPSRGACCTRPRRHNVVEPRFQCVLTQ
jgi:hypothetical protein